MRKRIFKGFAAVLLSSTLTVSTVFAVFADDVDKLKQQKQQTQQELDNLQDQWAYLLQQMDDLELKMANKSDEIDAANVKLEEAEKIQSAQYEDMKLRIKYMYEDQSVSLAEVFLTSSDMSTMLNKAVYMQEVYNYDRNKLDEMAQTASEIKELKEKLESDKQELDEAQTQLTEKQALLYSTIQETQAKADDVNSQLESAVKKAAEVAAKREQERQAAGKSVKEGFTVTLTVSKGKKMATIPDMVKKDGTVAESELKAAGFMVVKRDIWSEDIASGLLALYSYIYRTACNRFSTTDLLCICNVAVIVDVYRI